MQHQQRQALAPHIIDLTVPLGCRVLLPTLQQAGLISFSANIPQPSTNTASILLFESTPIRIRSRLRSPARSLTAPPLLTHPSLTNLSYRSGFTSSSLRHHLHPYTTLPTRAYLRRSRIPPLLASPPSNLFATCSVPASLLYPRTQTSSLSLP